MDPIINYYKIKLILNSVSNIFRIAFKERWQQDFNVEWKLDLAYLVKRKYTNFKSLTEEEKANVSTGNLNGWDLKLLCELLTGIQYTKIPKDKLDNENKIIQQIKEINDKFLLLKNYKIDLNEFKNFKDLLFGLIKEFSKENESIITKNSIESISSRIDEIPKPISLASSNSSIDSNDSSSNLIDLANEEFENENYQRSLDYYNDALLLKGFGDYKKSLILCKLSQVNLRYYQAMMLDGEYNYLFYIKKQQLQDSKKDAILACTLCPLNFEGYYRLAQLFCYMGDLELSLDYLNAALTIDPSNDEIRLFKNQVKSKIDSRIIEKDGKRNFQKEAQEFVEAHKFKDVYEGEDLELERYTEGIDKMAELYQLPKQHFINIACSRVAGTFSKKKDFETAAKYYSHAAHGDYAINSYRLGSLYERGLGVEKNLGTALSLYFEASLKPTKFDIPSSLPEENREFMEKNEGVILACVTLGHIFSKGIGAEMDADAAAYYFQIGVDHNNAEALYSLAQMYFYGMTSDKQINKPLAIELLKRGMDLGDQDCTREYYHFTGTKPPNRFTGEGVNASLKNFILIVSTVVILTAIISKLIIDYFTTHYGK
ncbi:hypothetical protein DICPUDRAFT_97128 [Dictyostelium purpureum]|uniref:Uncharacterized protein n=1 Tax=Dictyostelium purpureum TaxID=5786 RepID=F0ZE59_DICPU|nr:uncharacterized protein DICPUDRAFT_97128 [Dictyostelium purpureum]EGC37767.1 hypothetical protein DICPUDRAFT_97128 [Dictyostelium purpureum]|eukprot:XP_003285706.1 hypothetical protein DICPUDRAFT_97128 [Dictyostelium purpureum]